MDRADPAVVTDRLGSTPIARAGWQTVLGARTRATGPTPAPPQARGSQGQARIAPSCLYTTWLAPAGACPCILGRTQVLSIRSITDCAPVPPGHSAAHGQVTDRRCGFRWDDPLAGSQQRRAATRSAREIEEEERKRLERDGTDRQSCPGRVHAGGRPACPRRGDPGGAIGPRPAGH